ncbi:hypothetical protein BCR32DRAFT_303258 [Anaeromyces robustus]|uniref:Uncharacterized protein n=1 Tax=Anaeromyces robustus TaxID=1754192 RepID=A0A1Y1WTZ1_9FUNG|nr:hypothetical protein BCR32DRAFT_303258 [Anaeromyces robustus]|eukprot:ORX76706.1 hypothetical protein BCR32DRAFT_303258 [Anaeromyces robustus]
MSSDKLSTLISNLNTLYDGYVEEYPYENDDDDLEESNNYVNKSPEVLLNLVDTNANSISNEEKLLSSLDNLEHITKKSSDNISDNNSKSSYIGLAIRSDLKINCDVNDLAKRIESFDVNDTEGLKTLLNEYQKLNNIDNNNYNDEIKVKKTYHRKIIHKLKLLLVRKLQEAINKGKLEDFNSNDKSISKVDTTNKLGEINQSDNDNFKVISRSAIYDDNQVKFIGEINHSTNFIKYFANDMKREIANLPNNNLSKAVYNKLTAFYKLLESQASKIMSYETPDGNSNVIVKTFIMSDELNNGLEFHSYALIQGNINDIITNHNKKDSNNKLFNGKLIDNSSVISERQKRKWGFKSTIVIDSKVLNSVMLTPGDSIPDTFGKIMSQGISKESFTDVKIGYVIKNNLHKYEYPISIRLKFKFLKIYI